MFHIVVVDDRKKDPGLVRKILELVCWSIHVEVSSAAEAGVCSHPPVQKGEDSSWIANHAMDV